MKILTSCIGLWCFLPSNAVATDWDRVQAGLETLQIVLEEQSRAKQENRPADMQRLLDETNQIQAERRYRYEQEQAEQRRQADARRAAQQRAYQNSAQYKHNQKLLKAIQQEKTSGYGSSGYQQNTSTYSSNSSRYRPPQSTAPQQKSPGYQPPASSYSSPNYSSSGYSSPNYSSPRYSSSTSQSSAKPTGITVNQPRSTYTPSNTYDADSLDASGVGLHDVTETTNSSNYPQSSTMGGLAAPSGRCVQWKKVAPYSCSGIYGLSEETCTTICVKYEYD